VTPYAQGKRWTLYAGDCRDVLPSLTDVDAIVSDPPYGIAYRKGAGGVPVTNRKSQKVAAPRKDWTEIAGDAEPFDPSHLFTFPKVMLWGANHFAERLPRGRWLAWNKLGDFEPFGDSFSDVEFGWVNQRGADRIFSLLWKGVRQGEKIDNGRRHHPSMKPIGLMRWSIEQAGATADGLIVDPYAGSGATGIAALLTGRRFVGIEIDPQHLPVCVRRLAEAEAGGVQLQLASGAA
jgi:site-specific DNA-methyltransferase (adenine-specific)